MAYLYTGSTNEANMATGLSTQVIIEVNNQPVGAIQSFKPQQQRAISGVAEVGTDGFIEKIPHKATEIKIEIQRVMFDRLRLPAAFARQFVNISAQRVPFDVRLFDKGNVLPDNAEADGDVGASNTGVISHVYKNCWFTNFSTTYSASDYIVMESATISCEFVRSFQGQNQSVIDGGLRGIIPDSSGGNIELLADLGRRGSLDAAGLNQILNFQ